MSMEIPKQNDEILSRKTLRTLTDSELASETEETKRVAGGHTTNPPVESTYAEVISQESGRISFTLSVLNDLDFLQLIFRMLILLLPVAKR